MKELIERAIQSAEARIYKLEQGQKRNHTVKHQEKAENQAELQRVTVEALKKQLAKKPLDIITDDNEFICMICPSCQQIAVEFDDRYCRRCGQALDWSVE